MAAIDCGTNSTRLLVVGADGRRLCRLMRITRLGQGVDATGSLTPEAVARTVAVLAEFRAQTDALGVVGVRVSATSAARDASNRERFLAAVEEVVGARPELLTGEQEGLLSFTGATAELDPAGGPYLVVDIGGGSTEVVLGAGTDGSGLGAAADGMGPVGAISVDLGCVRVTERFLHQDPPTAQELDQAGQAISAELDRVAAALPGMGRARTLVGLAGTVTTLAAIQLGLNHYDRDRIHHAVLTAAQVADLLTGLAGEDRVARLRRPGLEEARADVIVGGALILASLMTITGLDRCLVSESDILDGMVMSLSAPAGARSR